MTKILDDLKRELQEEHDASKFECVVAELIGRLLGVQVALARHGSQYGGDSGVVGQNGRRLRIECKKYRDTSSLSERELLGEVAQALARDEALEAWILVTTRKVPEQTRQTLDQSGDKNGIPIVIIDWTCDGNAPLAALFASDPELVSKKFSNKAGVAASALQPVFQPAISNLRRHLESWCLGFESLRQKSHVRLNKIWNCPRESKSVLGQNAAGGSWEKKIRRDSVHNALYDWWRGEAQSDAPAALVGLEGTGKTWAILNWLICSQAEQPVVLVIPASALDANFGVSLVNVKKLMARWLYELSEVRNSDHWLRRLEYLLKRPTGEAPVLTVVFDGLNQEPFVPWLRLLEVFQSECFAGRVRVIISTRKHYFENRLASLNSLFFSPVQIGVGLFDTTLGGELDKMLAQYQLSREDLHPDVIWAARTPRLFALVMRLRDKLLDSGQITIHRLLWEYGRDTLGIRAATSFSNEEWIDWLKRIARKHREGFKDYSVRSLEETVTRPSLRNREVSARLSDIIDGNWATRNESGILELTPTVVGHALGLLLLDYLSQGASTTFAALHEALQRWLDPISGLDQQSEILRAAVSILIEQGGAMIPTVPGVLITAWLHAQNVPDMHRQEIVNLAPNFPVALLDAIEHSDSRAFDSARSWAVKALRSIPRSSSATRSAIIARATRWLMTLSRNKDTGPIADEAYRKRQWDKLRQRIGSESLGLIVVAGYEVNIIDESLALAQATIPSLIEGFPLAEALPIFEAAAIEVAVMDRSNCWNGLRWICLLNEVDPQETASRLRKSSEIVRHRNSEPGIHPDIPRRVAALLLFLTFQEQDKHTAASINPKIGRYLSYEDDYLSQPSRSLFPLERRHAEIVFNDTELPLRLRIERIGQFWLDPSFVPPKSFIAEVINAAKSIEAQKLDQQGGLTRDDFEFEAIEPVLARFAPDLLADLMRRKMQNLEKGPPESQYWKAINMAKHLLLTSETEIAAARALRMNWSNCQDNDKAIAANELLMVETRDLNGLTQFTTLIQADLQFVSSDLAEILCPLTPDEVDVLVSRYSVGTQKQRLDLLRLLSLRPPKLNRDAWDWIKGYQNNRDYYVVRKLVFKILAHADLRRFGESLFSDNWSWKPEEDVWVSHFATDALIEASSSHSFGAVAPRLAPWRLLESVRRRGAESSEVRLAAKMFSDALESNGDTVVDLGSDLSIDVTRFKQFPFSYSLTPRWSNREIADYRYDMTAEAHKKAYNWSIETAEERIRETRMAGAGLLHAVLDSKDFDPVLLHAQDYVERWLQGISEPTKDFQRRVLLAEGVFLAFCEALLNYDPKRGSRLWHVLRETMTTQFIGDAGLEELQHMVFRVSDSPRVLQLRKEIAETKYCSTDKELFRLAVSASYNDNTEWLDSFIEEDRASPFAWRQCRAEIMKGFKAGNPIPATGAWPDGEMKKNRAQLSFWSHRSRWIEACARHWWQRYLEASNPVDAYAAWVLFLRTVDRRAWVWMRMDDKNEGQQNPFFEAKMTHWTLNGDNLERAIKQNEEKLQKKFLQREIIMGVGPWTQ